MTFYAPLKKFRPTVTSVKQILVVYFLTQIFTRKVTSPFVDTLRTYIQIYHYD